MASWVNVSQMTHVLHTEEIEIISIAGGHLEIEPFCVLDLDRRVVSSLIFHCCETGKIHSWTEEVICHLFQSGPDTCVKLDCWELNPKQYTDSPDICWNPDPCARLAELRCCLMERKDGVKTSWSFRDASGSYQVLSANILMQLISEAELECDQRCGRNTRCLTYRCPSNYCR